MGKRVTQLLIATSLALALCACQPSQNTPKTQITEPDSHAQNVRSNLSWQTLGQRVPMPAANDSGIIASQNAKIYYAEYGDKDGEPLILLHGGLGSTESWANQIAALRNYRIITIASRGHGRSTRGDTPYSIQSMSQDVLNVMDEIGVDKAPFLGWSDGANIGLYLAMHKPERVKKLMAFGANYDASGARDDYEANPNFHAFLEKAQSEYERLSPTPKEFGDFVGAITQMWEVEPNFAPADLRAITVPVAVIFGEHDEFIQLQHTRDLSALIPNAQLILLPNSSHFALWQESDAFNAAVIEFIKTKA